jgi:hypothetical protein
MIDWENYGTVQRVTDEHVDTLLEAHRRAAHTFATCGGHKLADRAYNVVNVVSAELLRRGVTAPAHDAATCNLPACAR